MITVLLQVARQQHYELMHNNQQMGSINMLCFAITHKVVCAISLEVGRRNGPNFTRRITSSRRLTHVFKERARVAVAELAQLTPELLHVLLRQTLHDVLGALNDVSACAHQSWMVQVRVVLPLAIQAIPDIHTGA